MHAAITDSNDYQKQVISLSGHLLLLGASSSYLNRSNSKQGFICSLGKPVRCLGRGVYAFGVVALAAPAGVVYHIFQGFACYFSPMICRESLRGRAFDHWNAALVDGKVFLRGSLMTAVGVLAVAAAVFAFSQGPCESLVLGTMAAYLPLYKCNPIARFMFSPDHIVEYFPESISMKMERYAKQAGLTFTKQIERLFDGVDLVKQLNNQSLAGRWLLQKDKGRTEDFHSALKSYCTQLDGLKNTFSNEPSQVKAFVQFLLEDLIKLKNLSSYEFLFKANGDETLCKSIEDLHRWVQKKKKPVEHVDEGRSETKEPKNKISSEFSKKVDKDSDVHEEDAGEDVDELNTKNTKKGDESEAKEVDDVENEDDEEVIEEGDEVKVED